MHHLILQEGLDLLIFLLLGNLVSFLLDTISARIVIDHLPPELVLGCVLNEAQMPRFLPTVDAIRSATVGHSL